MKTVVGAGRGVVDGFEVFSHLGSFSEPGFPHENAGVESGGRYVGACVVIFPLALEIDVEATGRSVGGRVFGARVRGCLVCSVGFVVTSAGVVLASVTGGRVRMVLDVVG